MYRLSRKFQRPWIGLTSVLFAGSTSLAAETLECVQDPQDAGRVATWRQAAVAALTQGRLSNQVVAQQIAACFGPQIPTCMQRLADYTTRDDTASPYFDSTLATLEQKRPPTELLKPGAAGFEYIIPEHIEQLAAARGWPTVRYKSRHAGGFDQETASLLMVYVPGDRVQPPVAYDRWLNFALPADPAEHFQTPKPQAAMPSAADYAAEVEPAARQLPRTFTLVALDRRQGDTPSRIYFQKFHRSGRGNPVFEPEENASLASCISCHPNGLRALSPLGYHVRAGEAPLPEVDWKTVELINAAMVTAAGNKPVDWRRVVVDQATGLQKPLVNNKARGPVIGPIEPFNTKSRTKQFIMGETLADGTVVRGCYQRHSTIEVRDIFRREPGLHNVYNLSAAPAINWEKIRDSMRCASCHNDITRGALNELTSWSQIEFKILVDQSMPLGAHRNPLDRGTVDQPVIDRLTGDERLALTNCLQAEYELERKEIGTWLTQAVCQ